MIPIVFELVSMPRERSPPVCSQSVYVPLPQFVTIGNLPVPPPGYLQAHIRNAQLFGSQSNLLVPLPGYPQGVPWGGVDARPPDEHYLVRATACLGGRA